MTPIITVYSFNETYAELAAVSMTSLVYNTKRDCHIHIFENSLSEKTMEKLLVLEEMYNNVNITFHHVPDEKFSEVADNYFGKETWYPLLAPEILSDLDKALLLEPDTLICRDVSDLFDIELGDRYAAVRIHSPTLEQYGSDIHLFSDIRSTDSNFFNAGIILYNLKALRDDDVFNMDRLIRDVKIGRIYRRASWLAQQSYQSVVFNRENIVKLPYKYNRFAYVSFSHPFLHPDADYDEFIEAISNPAIIHYAGPKPNHKQLYGKGFVHDLILRWWEYLALSPFANGEHDQKRLNALIEDSRNINSDAVPVWTYIHHYMFDNMMDAMDKLSELTEEGLKVAFYGAGALGGRFLRVARYKNFKPDFVCDQSKAGLKIEGITVEHPEILRDYHNDCLVIIAIEDPNVWTEVQRNLRDMGFAEKRIIPIFENLAVNGRRWSELLESIESNRTS